MVFNGLSRLLIQRRLISKVIRDGYEHLSKEIEYDPISSDEHSADDIISQGESENIEFKSTPRLIFIHKIKIQE